MADAKGSEFYVGLKGIKLPKEVEERIADAIRRTVARELASLDLRPARGAGAGGGKAPRKGGAGGASAEAVPSLRRDWYGYILLKASGVGVANSFQGSAVNAGKTVQSQILVKGQG